MAGVRWHSDSRDGNPRREMIRLGIACATDRKGGISAELKWLEAQFSGWISSVQSRGS